MPKKKRKKIVETAPSKFSEDRWKVESDLEAVARAFAVKKDPDRMKKVKNLAKEKLDESKRKEKTWSNYLNF
jgi:hypothetical protein